MRKVYLLSALLLVLMQVRAEGYTVKVYSFGCTAPQVVLAPQGEQLIITAQPQTGYRFTQWSDGVTDNPRLVTVAGDSTFTAEYEFQPYTLTIYAMECSTPQVVIAPYGEQFGITAEPQSGSHFVQWSDGVTDNPRLVTVSGDASYTAEFSADHTDQTRYMVTIDASGCGNPQVVFAPQGEQLIITAVAQTGYHFTKWTDDNTDNPRSVTINGNAAYVAEFDQVSTDVEQVSAPSVASKILRNVHLYIVRNNQTYDTNGHKL